MYKLFYLEFTRLTPEERIMWLVYLYNGAAGSSHKPPL